MSDKIVKEIVTSTLILRMRADGIVLALINEAGANDSGIHIGIEIVEATKQLCGDKKHPMLVWMSDKRQLTIEERKYYKNADFNVTSKVAMIVNTPYERMLGNFFIGVNKLQMPCRLFSDEEKAIHWLKEPL